MAAPILSNQAPAPLQVGFNLARPITLDVTDADADLVAASVRLLINNVLVWDADAPASGRSVTKTAITNGFRYSIQHTQAQQPDAGTVIVSVYAQDGASNTLNERYSFVGANGLYFDDFENGVIDYTISNGLLGSTTITESGGRLVIDVSAGDNADWSVTGRNPKAAMFPLVGADAYGAVIVETELNAYTYNFTTSNHTMFVLWKDDFNFVYIGADNNTASIFSQQAIGGAWQTGTTFGNVSLPARFRFVWHQDLNTVLTQVFSSGAWQTIQTYQNVPKFTHAAIAHKEWSNETAHVEYSYLSAIGERRARLEEGRDVGASDSVLFPAMYAVELPIRAGVFDSAGTEIDGVVDTRAFPNLSPGYVLDNAVLRLGQTPTYNAATPSLDGEGHQHFTLTTTHPTLTADVLNVNVGDWANPTGTGFTGYAKDGFKYTAGVQDAGPVLAPWASEAAGANRSSKDGMPNKLLAVVVGALSGTATGHEVVLFDLDEYVLSGNLNVWMRIKPTTSYTLSGDNTSGRVAQQIGFYDGMLVMVLRQGTVPGVLNLVDFKSNTQHVLQVVDSLDHYIAGSGKTIVNRNDAAGMAVTTTLIGPECRITGTNPCGVAVTGSGTNVWIAVATEDGFTLLRAARSGGDTILQTYQNLEPVGPLDTPNQRAVMFDRYGQLWLSEQNRLWCCGFDYRGDVFVNPFSMLYPTDVRRRYLTGSLPSGWVITSITELRDSIYCAVLGQGVFRFDKATGAFHHAFNVSGGGGGGRANLPPAGEVIAGDKRTIQRLHGSDAPESGYLCIASAHGGGTAQVIRVHDNELMVSKVFPDLSEDGAYFARVLLRS